MQNIQSSMLEDYLFLYDLYFLLCHFNQKENSDFEIH